jgi:hypothetical protein
MSRSGKIERVLAACLAVAGMSGPPEPSREEERPERFSWPFAQRAYPLRSIRAGAHARPTLTCSGRRHAAHTSKSLERLSRLQLKNL